MESMILTGKCEKDFEKFRIKNYPETEHETRGSGCSVWEIIDESMQFGVLVDFLNTFKYENIPLFDYVFNKFYNIKIESQTHNDLVKQAIIKANEIYNNEIN